MNRNIDWNHKVAANRGPEWRKKLLQGRLEIQMNPTTVRLRRIKKNLTQGEVALKAGLSVGTYGAVESGRRLVSKEKAERIAKILSLQADKAFENKIKNKYIARNDK